jgi:hypothetical protein
VARSTKEEYEAFLPSKFGIDGTITRQDIVGHRIP